MPKFPYLLREEEGTIEVIEELLAVFFGLFVTNLSFHVVNSSSMVNPKTRLVCLISY